MTSSTIVPLSVLDVVPVFEGGSATTALHETVAIAPRVEELGYHRYWVAEHHGTPSLATSTPAVLAGRIAAATSRLRVGSGGVLLPNHAPLVVAEQFGTLQALFGDRIDLGLGRAPGTDPLTARALRRPPGGGGGEDTFADQITELTGYFAPTDPGNPVIAVPAADSRPQVWVLGSSLASAGLAAALGLPYAFAHHVNPQASVAALRRYRAAFTPSAQLASPRSLLSVLATVGDTDADARQAAAPYLLGKVWMRTIGLFDAFPSEVTTNAYSYSRAEVAFLDDLAAPQLIGGVNTVRRDLAALVEATGADELMALTIVPDQADRVRSFELLAQAASAPSPAARPGVSAQI
ncbi:LLM class flavin-dependent oxidoreductase [Frankia gtarii]|uniref:LLM class flavin-dependent oxidoreductase n=1 Tax=Frankia gtarii TaxID=2950102 RepID=UPI0021C2349C|nr:LLM class flavin-dependent oxidoreductase [Frankia gtarii]